MQLLDGVNLDMHPPHCRGYTRRMRRLWVLSAVLLGGCGAHDSQKSGTLPTPRCKAKQYFDGAQCREQARATKTIAAAAEALEDTRIEEAFQLLAKAQRQGPHTHEDFIRLNEQLGVAYAYAERKAEAAAAFETVLALNPRHALPYTMSPKATFIFEQVRAKLRKRPEPTLDVVWPRRLRVDDEVPLELEIVADPKSFLARAVVNIRRAGAKDFGQVGVDLSPKDTKRVVLPALSSKHPETLELFVTAFDDKGNEVLRWSSPQHPREIPLGYQPPAPWYRRWWVWAVAGGVVAASTGATVFLLGRDPPDSVPTNVSVR